LIRVPDHHNGTLLVSAGDYRFADYGRVDASLSIVVLLTAAFPTTTCAP
jgi:hypothetical protein